MDTNSMDVPVVCGNAPVVIEAPVTEKPKGLPMAILGRRKDQTFDGYKLDQPIVNNEIKDYCKIWRVFHSNDDGNEKGTPYNVGNNQKKRLAREVGRMTSGG